MSTENVTEKFDGYHGELKLVQADLSQKIDQISELSGEERKSAIRDAETSLEDANELLGQMRMEKASIPQASRSKVNQRLRDSESDIDSFKRKLQSLSSDRSMLFGSRYRDDPDVDEHLEQRQQLLSGTERLTRSTGRLTEAQRVANDTEQVGSETLQDLARQREQITNTRETLLRSEGYTDRSIKTLRGMARRMATNRFITIAIITVLVILIIAVIVSKFR